MSFPAFCTQLYICARVEREALDAFVHCSPCVCVCTQYSASLVFDIPQPAL
jgi:hypothetical protein